MGKERERIRRTPKKESEPKKHNFKISGFIILVLIIVGFKFIAADKFNETFGMFISKNTDYPSMFIEIGEVIKKHTTNPVAFITPVTGKITSPFGKRSDPITKKESEHFGIDIDSPLNTKVSACGNGKVIKAESNDYYGNFIMIDHGNALTSLYGHLSELKTSVGAEVKKGDVIALSGDSGRTTGPHLHFEIRKDNIPINPNDYISYDN